MQATNAAQYLHLVRKERKTAQTSFKKSISVVGSKQGDTSGNACPPRYLSHLLKIHQQQCRHADLASSTPLAEICCDLVKLQNRQVRALGVLSNPDTVSHVTLSAEVVATQFPTPKSLPPGDSPASLKVFQLLNSLADEGSVPFLPTAASLESKERRLSFRHWTTWLVAAMMSVDPLCLHEAEGAATISRLSRHMMSALDGGMEPKDGLMGERSNPLLDEKAANESESSTSCVQEIATCFLSNWESQFLNCLNYALIDLARAT